MDITSTDLKKFDPASIPAMTAGTATHDLREHVTKESEIRWQSTAKLRGIDVLSLNCPD